MNGYSDESVGTRGSSQKDVKIDITDDEIAVRKAWLELTQEDYDRVVAINAFVRSVQDEVVEKLYDHFLSFEEPRQFFVDPQVLQRVKNLQKDYFNRLTSGNYGRDYFENRLNVGAVHAKIGLDPKWYLGAYNFHMRNIAIKIFEEYKGEPEKALDAFLSLTKLKFLDIGLAIDTYISQREATINRQQEAIRELSTPVLKLRDRLLILPIIGTIDTQRARQLTEQLLHSIRDTRATVVVIDITGVPAVDSRVANHLVQTVDASRLMGATVIVTGLSAEVAQTLVQLGVDLTKLNTVGDLQGGLEEAERLLGFVTVRSADSSRGSRSD